MKPHVRLLVALLALLASTAPLSGGGWTTLCAMARTRMEHASVEPAGADPMAAAGIRHRHAQDTPPDGRPLPSCPLAATHAPCVPAVLAVSASYAFHAPRQEQASQPAVSETPPDLLLASSLFRPPQG
jgi:hypothetical protein